jgi:hypothetical protein
VTTLKKHLADSRLHSDVDVAQATKADTSGSEAEKPLEKEMALNFA